jgi:uncharacterized membrane protein
MNQIRQILTDVRESLWFVPGVMLALALLLALGLIAVDVRIERDFLIRYSLVFGLGADGSRGMLTAIASSMLTVAALAFTLTLNAVAQSSSQYSPRVIRNYLSDKSNQFVFGYFVSVFAYCLVVLRTIRGGDEDAFIPSIAVFVGLILALGGVIVLIFFIHHIAVSLQVTSVIADIVRVTRGAIDDFYPEDVGEPIEDSPLPTESALRSLEDREWIEAPAENSGYVQTIDSGGLVEFAKERRLIVQIPVGVGDFIAAGAPIAFITAGISDAWNGQICEDVADEINTYFSVDRHRSIDQDVAFGIRQLVDIALKALSPGVNDTTTAINAIDRLGELVAVIGARRIPSNVRTAEEKAILFVTAPSFGDYLEYAFDEIRISGKGNSAVFARLIDALAMVFRAAKDEGRRTLVLRQVDLTVQYADETLETAYERGKFETHLDEKMQGYREAAGAV